MAVFNVSVLSIAPISGTMTVRASSEKEAISLARDAHRSAQITWMTGRTRAGAFTGKIDNIWAKETSAGVWLVSMTASLPVSKVVSVEAETREAAEAIARRDVPYTGVDDWRYQSRPFSPASSTKEIKDWSFLAPSPVDPDYTPPTRTSLEIIPNPTQETVMTVLSSVVSSNDGLPTGIVTFYEDVEGTAVSVGTDTLTNGHAVISIPAPEEGLHVYYAVYGGDSGFETSTSPEQTLVVTGLPRETSVLITFESNPYIMVDASVEIYATVSGAGVVTGTVDFYNGDPNVPGEATFLGTESVIGGVATLSHTLSGIGSFPVYGVYSGDVEHDQSTSPQATLLVVPEIVVTSVVPNNGPESGGTSVTVNGSGFNYVIDDVRFNGELATNVVLVNNGQITCDTPAGTGTADVLVSAYYGNSGNSGNNLYTYTTGPQIFTPVWQNPSDIRWDESHLWVTDYGNAYVSKVDPTLAEPKVTAVIDLSSYGVTATECAAIGDGIAFILSTSTRIVAIDIATNAVVGLGDMPVGYVGFSTAYDPDDEKLWVSARNGINSVSSRLFSFNVSNMISSYPTPISVTDTFGPYTAPNPYGSPGSQTPISIFQIAYSSGKIYVAPGTADGNPGVCKLLAIDTATGIGSTINWNPLTELNHYAQDVMVVGGSVYLSTVIADQTQGYLVELTTGGSDVSKTPIGTNVPNDLTHDGTDIWVSWADQFIFTGFTPTVTRLSGGTPTEINQLTTYTWGISGIAATPYGIWCTMRAPGEVWRIDPGTNTFDYQVVSIPPDVDQTINFTDAARNSGIQEFAFDGTYIWGAHRPWNEGNGSIAKFDPSTDTYLLNWEGPVGNPLWEGAASIVFDGTYLWVSDAATSGFDEIVNQYIRVIDPSTTPPTLVDSIDISAFAPMNVVRKLRMSRDGQYVFASVKGSSFPVVAGRVLVINKTTRAIVGNAQLSTANISGSPPSGARDAIDSGDGKLWVVNSAQVTTSRVERFNLATVLSNGTSPTSPVTTLDIVNHAEELVYAEGYIWTSGWNWSDAITRIDPSDDDVSADLDLSNRFMTGLTYAFGWLWAGDFSDNLYRLDPDLFGTGNMVTHTISLPSAYHSVDVRNGMVSDGTHLWIPVRRGENNGFGVTGISQQFKIFPGEI